MIIYHSCGLEWKLKKTLGELFSENQIQKREVISYSLHCYFSSWLKYSGSITHIWNDVQSQNKTNRSFLQTIACRIHSPLSCPVVSETLVLKKKFRIFKFLQVILYTRILVRLRRCAREARTAQLQDIGEDGRGAQVEAQYSFPLIIRDDYFLCNLNMVRNLQYNRKFRPYGSLTDFTYRQTVTKRPFEYFDTSTM